MDVHLFRSTLFVDVNMRPYAAEWPNVHRCRVMLTMMMLQIRLDQRRTLMVSPIVDADRASVAAADDDDGDDRLNRTILK